MADSFTRRTHIVRIPQDEAKPDDMYVDVEVLDALAFKGPMGEELVLNFKQGNISVWCDDSTGGGNERHQGNPTRRSHMERKSHNGMLLDVEVLDAIAFRTKNGEEWILNLPSKKSSAHSTNDTSDSGENSRRTHTEKISEGFKKNPTEYVKVVRADQVAFRTIMGKEMIIKMPSNDDPNSSDRRASTYISSPKGYNPTNDDGPKPPMNKDKNIYVSFPKDTKGPWVKDERIKQGMLWWIRKVKAGGGILYLTFEYDVSQNITPGPHEPKPTIRLMPQDKGDGTEYQFFGDIYEQVDPAVDPTDVVNPVSPAMFSGLYQWTPTAPWIKRTTNGVDATILYFVSYGPEITAENAFEPAVPPSTNQCGLPSTFGSAYGGSFFQCNFVAQAEAASHGFTNITILEQGQWGNAADAGYVAAAFNSLAFSHDSGLTLSVIGPIVIAPPATVVRIQSRAVAAFNIGKIKTFADPRDTTFQFEIVVPESNDGGWKLKGSVYKTEKDFPLNAENTPTFTFTPDDKVEKNIFTGRTTITVTVDFKDFTVNFQSEAEANTEGEG